MKSKKGKADASDSEDTHEEEVECKDDVAASEPESAADEDVKVKSKRKSRHGKKKGNNTGSEDGGTESKKRKGNNTASEDGGTESKKRKRNVPVNEKAEAVEYEVDKVMEVHFKKNGSREFLIHWKGFSHKEDTWEPEKNLNCPDLIEKFMEKVDKAKSAAARELRANPQHTDRFTLNVSQAGRRLSRRNQGKQR